eukprot:gene1681-2102_t
MDSNAGGDESQQQAKLISLSGARDLPVTFNRRELDQILRIYGFMVSAGEWRDYAIDHLNDRACRCSGSRKIRGWPASKAPTA